MIERAQDPRIAVVSTALAKRDGLDFHEVCGFDAADGTGSCDSSTCVSAHWEDHDAEAARAWYDAMAHTAIKTIDDECDDDTACGRLIYVRALVIAIIRRDGDPIALAKTALDFIHLTAAQRAEMRGDGIAEANVRPSGTLTPIFNVEPRT